MCFLTYCFVITEAYKALLREGIAFILRKFDVLYSALIKFDKMGISQQEVAWRIVTQSFQQLITDLDKHFSSDNSSDQETCHELLNITKMLAYLLCSFHEHHETRGLKVVPGSVCKTGQKKRTPTSDHAFDLEATRNFVLVSLDQLLQKPIHKLWSPKEVEQEFMNMMSNLCFKVLENPSISHVRMIFTREHVFKVIVYSNIFFTSRKIDQVVLTSQVIGCLVKRYSHKLSCTLKTVRLLQDFEHVVPACVHGLVMLIEHFDCSQMVLDLVQEIGRIDPQDLVQDTSSSRNYAAFLSELAEKIPSVFIPCVSLLSIHLEEDSFTMRNGVLSIFAEIVIQVRIFAHKFTHHIRTLLFSF